jgi:hypothetical protein
LATVAGASVVVEESLTSKLVTVELSGVAFEAAIGAVARHVGADVARVGSVYFIGTRRPEDRAVLVRVVPRLGPEELRGAVSVVLGDVGRAQVFPDGLVVVSDKVEVLARVSEVLDAVAAAPFGTWVVQLYLISLTQEDMRDFGMTVSPTMGLNLGAKGGFSTTTGAVAVPAASASAEIGLSAVLNAASRSAAGGVVAQPLMLIRNGGKGKVARGESVPVPRRSVSPQGTVQTVGFDRQQVGTEISVTIREAGLGVATLGLTMQLSGIIGFVEGIAPRTSVESLECESVVSSRGVYLLGALTRDAENDTAEGIRIGKKEERVSQVLQVWARVYQVLGAADRSAAARPGAASIGPNATKADEKPSLPPALPVPAPGRPLQSVPPKGPAFEIQNGERAKDVLALRKPERIWEQSKGELWQSVYQK